MKQSNRRKSYLFLLLVPVLVAAFGFGIGKIDYKIYLPVWILNVLIMMRASWLLGLYIINTKSEKVQLATAAFLLIVPWMLMSMFFGLGPPPGTAAAWVATATEQ